MRTPVHRFAYSRIGGMASKVGLSFFGHIGVPLVGDGQGTEDVRGGPGEPVGGGGLGELVTIRRDGPELLRVAADENGAVLEFVLDGDEVWKPCGEARGIALEVALIHVLGPDAPVDAKGEVGPAGVDVGGVGEADGASGR